MLTQSVVAWSNWSASVKSSPRQIYMPRSIEDLVCFVKKQANAGGHIRVVGAGHSFTPLAQTDDILITLDNLQGIEAVSADQRSVTILAGTQLKLLGKQLHERGLAQENLGDIDVQSIAGAISTGTHGTGIHYGSLATQVESITLLTASGEILECSTEQNPEIFKAAQVSLGLLGIIIRVQLRVVPAKRLHYIGQRKELTDCLANVEQYRQQNSHFEFFWFPYTNQVQAKFINETDAPVSGDNLWGAFNKIALENGVYWLLCETCRLFPGFCKPACAISGQAIANVDETNYSHRLFATPRLVRFNEMEYNIPMEYTREVFAEIQHCIEKYQFAVNFPVECRFVQADDIWLSPAYQRASAYIAVHMYRGMPYREYFYRIEEIFKRYQGRPHWGKLHTRTSTALAQLYPHWQDFQRVRSSLDPQGVFLNTYLRQLFCTHQ